MYLASTLIHIIENFSYCNTRYLYDQAKEKLIYNVIFLFTDNSLGPLFLNTIKEKHMVYQIGDAIMIITTIEKVRYYVLSL